MLHSALRGPGFLLLTKRKIGGRCCLGGYTRYLLAYFLLHFSGIFNGHQVGRFALISFLGFAGINLRLLSLFGASVDTVLDCIVQSFWANGRMGI